MIRSLCTTAYWRYAITLMVAVVVCGPLFSHAQFNPEINYQAKLTDDTGMAVTNGNYDIVFSLYTASTSGSAVWTESRTGANDVTVQNGLFSVMLGDVTALSGVDFDQTLYLGVTVGADSEMTPRKVLGTVPAAFVAAVANNANQLGGVASSSFLRSDQADTLEATSASTLLTVTQNGAGNILDLFDGGTNVFTVTDGGNVGLGTTTPGSRLTVAGDAYITGALRDSTNSAGTAGYVLQTTGSGTQWVATSSLGLSSQTLSLGTDNQIPFMNSGGTDYEYSSNFTFNGTNVVLGGTTGISLGGDVSLNRSVANRLDVATGDSLNLVSGALQVGGTTVIDATRRVFTDDVISGNDLHIRGDDLIIFNVGSERMRIDGGDVAIGTTSTLARLSVQTSGTTDILNLFETGGVEVFTVLENGNVGIGNTTPTSRLSVAGDVSITGALRDSTNSAGTAGYVLQTTGSGTQWVATSSLGFSGQTLALGTDNQIPFMNSGGDDFEYSGDITFDGTNLGLGAANGIAFGGIRMFYASSTSRNIAIGEFAGGQFNANTIRNVALGYNAGAFANNSNADRNNYIGYTAGINNEGSDNNFVGNSAGFNNIGSINNSIGLSAGIGNAGDYNNLIGAYSGNSNFGDYNNIFGYLAGYSNTGSYNNIFGNSAGFNNSSSYSEFIGFEAAARMSASNTIAIGQSALRGGSGSASSGNAATTTNNTALGAFAGYSAQTGADNNLLLGYRSGYSLTTGANNIVIGYDVEAPSNTGSNQLNIGNLLFGTGIDGTGTTLSTGNIGIGTSSPSSKLTVAGDVRITGALRDSSNSAGTNGYVLQTTGSGTQWVATSSLGISSGSSVTFGTDNQIPFMNVGGTDYDYSSNFTFNDTNLVLGGTTGISLGGDVVLNRGAANRLDVASGDSLRLVSGSLELNTDVSVSRGAANRFDLATGDSFNIVSGALQVAATTVVDSSRRIFAANGAAGAGTLAYSFSADTNTGLFGTGSDVLGFVAGGTERTRLTTTNLDLSGTNVGLAFQGVRMFYASTTNDSIAIGELAGEMMTNVSTDNVAIGRQAGRYASSTLSDRNVFIGFRSGESNTGGNNNLLGESAGRSNSGSDNNIFGWAAGLVNSGSDNNMFGRDAGGFNTGSNNNIMGYGAGFENIGFGNNMFGVSAGGNNIGEYNNLMGYIAGAYNTGSNNNIFGNTAGFRNTGSYSEFIGYEAAAGMSASNTIAIGRASLRGGSGSVFSGNLATTTNNTAIGAFAGYSAQTGADNNLLLGYRSGYSLTTGANNIVIGYDVEAPSNTGSNQLNIGNLLFGTGVDGIGTTFSTGNIGIGTSSPGSKLTVAGTTRIIDRLLVGASAEEDGIVNYGAFAGASTDGMLALEDTFSNFSFNSVAGMGLVMDVNPGTNYVGVGTGVATGIANYVETRAGNSFNLNQLAGTDIRVNNSGNGDIDTVAGQFINITNTGTGNIIDTFGLFIGDITSGSQTNVFSIYSEDVNAPSYFGGDVGIGTTTPRARLSLQETGITGAGVSGIDQYMQYTNSTASAVMYGNYAFNNFAPTATSTLVANMIRVADNTSLGNTVRGLEVQVERGVNTFGENTAISGFARTFGVRGVTEADAGGSFEPAGGFFESRGTTQGNAIRGYSGSITTAAMAQLFQDTSTFTGTGLLMNFGNAGGSFSSTTASRFIDLQNAGSSRFTVGAYGMLTIGNGGTTNSAGIQIGYGGLCVDNDGACTANVNGRIASVSQFSGNSDLAEMYFSSENLLPGEIVYAKDGLSIGRADEETAQNIIGVVSTKPGVLLGYDDTSLVAGEEGYPVALSGRVPIRLSTENGPIAVGDELMLSSIPGVAMKATSTGKVIGTALEAFNEARAYSDTYINQFGDDIADPVYTPVTAITDPRINDGCYYGGGAATNEAPCVPLTGTTTDAQVLEAEQLAAAAAQAEALEALRYVPSTMVTLEDGETVQVGQIVMFVDLRTKYLTSDSLAFIESLMGASTTVESIGGEDQPLFERVLALASRFVDGVLSVLTLKADRVETSELCVDGVCVTADDLRRMLDSAPAAAVESTNDNATTGGSQIPQATPEPDTSVAPNDATDLVMITEPVASSTAPAPEAETTEEVSTEAGGAESVVEEVIEDAAPAPDPAPEVTEVVEVQETAEAIPEEEPQAPPEEAHPAT